MPNDTVRANATALPKTIHPLARTFIAALRDAGHRPYVASSGRFGIILSIAKRTVAEATHHNGPGYAYTLGFDDWPFLPLRDNPNWIGEVAPRRSKLRRAEHRQQQRQIPPRRPWPTCQRIGGRCHAIGRICGRFARR